jgi:hypothetical protein
MEKEIWKNIPGYEDYQVSNEGKVRSLKFGKIRELQQDIGGDYYRVALSINGNRKLFGVHVLVAMTFLNHIPDGNNLVVDHIDENQLNNKLQNLRIVTQRDNLSRQKRDLPTGVCWFKRDKKYKAQIDINGKRKHLGYFSTPEAASEAYQKALANLNG